MRGELVLINFLCFFLFLFSSEQAVSQINKFKKQKNIAWSEDVELDYALDEFQYTNNNIGNWLSILKQKEYDDNHWSNFDATLSQRLLDKKWLFSKGNKLYDSAEGKKILTDEELLVKMMIPKVVKKGTNWILDTLKVEPSDIFCYRLKGVLYYDEEMKRIGFHPQAIGLVVFVPNIAIYNIKEKYDYDLKYSKKVLFWIQIKERKGKLDLNNYHLVSRTSKKFHPFSIDDNGKWSKSVYELLNKGCEEDIRNQRQICEWNAKSLCHKRDSLIQILDKGVHQYEYDDEMHKRRNRLSRQLQIHHDWAWNDKKKILELSTLAFTIYIEGLDEENLPIGADYPLFYLMFEY